MIDIRQGRSALILLFLAAGGCSSRGASALLPAANAGMPMATVRSVSPALIAAPPMAKTALLPASAMTSRTPSSILQPPLGWTQLPGGAIFVAASPDGSIWVLSSQGSGPDRAIFHYAGGVWTNIPGAAMRLAVGPDNTLWAINSAGGIYSYSGGSWSTLAGGASDISIGPDGSVYVISSLSGGPSGRGIWQYSGGAWTQLPGAAIRIVATSDTGSYPNNIVPGGVWVINAAQTAFYYRPGAGFFQQPGSVGALAPTNNGGMLGLGSVRNPDGSYPVYYYDFDSANWTQQAGSGISIASNGTRAYAVGVAGGIYTSTISSVTVPIAPVVGYLPATGTGSFGAQLTSVTSGATVIGISTDELTGNGSLTPGSLAFRVGGSELSIGRRPEAARPAEAGPHAPLERAVEGPAELAALTSRLRTAPAGVQTQSFARRTNTLGTTVGSHTSFWVTVAAIGTSGGSDVQVAATLQKVATNGYVWVDDSLLSNAAFMGANEAATFTSLGIDLDNAYVSDTTHYGATSFTSSSPGIANHSGGYSACNSSGAPLGTAVPVLVAPPDSKINAFVINSANLGSGVGGYFSAVNYVYQSAWNCLIGTSNGSGGTYTAQTIPHSNEAPMIYVGYYTPNSSTFELNEDLVRGTAHELQHLINFVNHVALHDVNSEDTWINEGMSMLAQDFAVNRLYSSVPHDVDDALYHANAFTAAAQNVSLTGFTGIDAGQSSPHFNCSACYGAEFLFQRYLYDRFGGDAYLGRMLGGQTSYAALNTATGVAPKTLISDFAIALAASGSGRTADPRFGFTSLSLPAAYTDQFGTAHTVGNPANTALPSSAAPYLGTFAYYSVGSAALNQYLSGKDLGGNFNLEVGVVQR